MTLLAGEGPLEVWHLLPHLRQSGNGIVNMAVSLACSQAKAGLRVTVAAPQGQLAGRLALAGCRVIELAPLKPANFLQDVRRLKREMGLGAPSIIHAHSVKTLAYAIAARDGRTAVVASAHNDFNKTSVMLRFADHTMAVSHAGARNLSRMGIRKMTVVHNGLPTMSMPLSASPGSADHILFVGGLNRRKGVDVLISAFGVLAGDNDAVVLDIVGDGPESQQLRELAGRTPHASRVRFHGFKADYSDWLRTAGVFVLPSRQEPFGLVLLEALRANVPVVASAVDGIPEVLGYGARGLLVPPDSPNALAEAIRTVLRDDARRPWLHSPNPSFLEYFSMQRVHRETLAVYLKTREMLNAR